MSRSHPPVLLFCAAAQAQTPDWGDQIAFTHQVSANVVYSVASGVELKLDVYRPRNAAAPVAVAMFIHGGGWVAGDKKDLGGMTKCLAAGISVVSINYRYSWQAQIAGVKPPPNIDGISILRTLLGQRQTKRHGFFYWEFHERGSKQAVRMGDWKGVRLSPDQPLELYNLKNDLGEKENIASKNPEVVAKIEAYLKTARTESAQWPLQPAPTDKAEKK